MLEPGVSAKQQSGVRCARGDPAVGALLPFWPPALSRWTRRSSPSFHRTSAIVAQHSPGIASARDSLVAEDVLCQPPRVGGWRLAVKRFALGPCGPPVG
jgi:hypothetical protein